MSDFADIVMARQIFDEFHVLLPFESIRAKPADRLVKSLVFLNLFDTLATLLLLRPSEEANPLASAALAASPLLFILCKLAMVWMGAVVLGVTESVRALSLLVGLYAGVCGLHLVLVAVWLFS